MNYILDAGPLIAAINRRDSFHEWAVKVFKAVREPLFTCSEALAEAAALTRQPAAIVELVRDGTLLVDFSLAREAEAVFMLLRKYEDQGMDLADACIVRMSELMRESTVITVDRRDFSVYRKNERDEIPILAP